MLHIYSAMLGGGALAAGATSTIGFIAVLIAAVFSATFARNLQLRSNRIIKDTTDNDGPTIETQLHQLSSTIEESASLIEKVSAEIDAKKATAAKIEEEAQESERLASLNKDAREAVAHLIQGAVTVDSQHMFRLNLIVNAGFFVAGILGTIAVTIFIHVG